ncbi:MAG: LytTR family DNA-binding domain-containing protein [Bacteroidetes bacterium]|nr:LytTR family DNA-binding domain-containing protein [Bacteroidota bacterium]
MTCLIVDDNKVARTTIKQLASQVKDLSVAGDCATALDAYNFLQEKPVDILLLDIEMPGMSGIELTRQLSHQAPIIIFTTSKKEYAVEAFELAVADYIVKPVTPARFLQAIDRARTILDNTKAASPFTRQDNFLFIRDSNIIRRLLLDDLLFAEAMGDFVKLHTASKTYVVHTTLKAVEERLPADRFLRTHRSFIAAIGKVDSVQDGDLIIQGKPVPVADAYRAAVNKRLNVL